MSKIYDLPFNIDLEGKTAVVTGAGGVLCKEFALALAACKANVVLIDINYDSIKALEEEITQNGGKSLAIKASVLDKNELQSAHDTMVKTFGECEILVNGAGGNSPKGTTSNEYFSLEDLNNSDIKTFFDLDYEGIKFVFDLNFLGILLPTQVFAKDLLSKENPNIINISSMNAFTPLTKIPAYSGAKAAVSNFTQWLAVHFSRQNIRVNAIAPGFFVTNQNYALLHNEDGSFTARADKIINSTPMQRFGEPKELIGTLLWLLSKEASGFVTGTVIPVDGGFSAYSGV